MAASFLTFLLQFLCQIAKLLVILDFVMRLALPSFRPGGAFQPLMALGNRLAAPALLFLLMVTAYWRILLTDQYSWMNGHDISSQVLPWLQFQAGEWKAGRVPLWSPYEWAGQNLVGQGQPGVFNPMNWLLFAAPLRRGWLREGVLHWWFFLLHYIAALNLFVLARGLGAGRLPAILGGLCFGLLGFLGSNDWPQMISGVIWAPLAFHFLLRARLPRYALPSATLAGICLGLCWLSGHHQLPIFVSLGLAGGALALRIHSAAWSFLIGGLIAAPQLLTGLAYGRLAVRWVGMEDPIGWQDKVAYFVHEQYANPPAALLSVLLPGAEHHTSLFLGTTALGLAVWALRTQWQRPEIRFFFLLGLAALLYGMGRQGLIEPVLYSLAPMVEKARSPSMAAALFTLSFSLLAAVGAETMRQNSGASTLWRWHAGFAAAVAGLFLFAKLFPAAQSQLDQRWFGVAVASALTALGYRALASGHLSLRHWSPLMLFAMLLESANMTYYDMGNRHDRHVKDLLKPLSQFMDVRDYLATRPAPVRITVDDQKIPFNFGDWHGVEVMGGYLASLTRIQSEVDWFLPRTLPLAGIGYHIGPAPRIEGSRQVFEGQGGIKVWEYPLAPFPRAFLVNHSLPYRDTKELGLLLQNDALDLRTTALTVAPLPALEECAPGEALMTRHDPNRVSLISRTRCRSLLVLADPWDPGWDVRIDGKPAEPLRVYHALRGVIVPAGSHTVEWHFFPAGLRAGLACAVTGSVLVVLGLFFHWPQDSRKQRRFLGPVAS